MYLIYCHTNKTNGKKYIGQTSKTMEERWKKHCLDAKNEKYSKHYSNYFKSAIRKYGEDDWIHEILEDNIQTIEEANQAEIKYISFYQSNIKGKGYNIDPGGTNFPLAEQTKEKLRIAQTGKIQTEDTKNKNRLSQLAKPKKEGCSSKYKGVFFESRRNCWIAQFKYKKHNYHSKEMFKTEDEAYQGRLELEKFILNASEQEILEKYPEDSKQISQLKRSKKENSTSKYKGVWFSKRHNKWIAELKVNQKKVYIGIYSNEEDAYQAVLKKKTELGIPIL